MTNYFIGIDPGHQGAIAVINGEFNTVSIEDCPLLNGQVDTMSLVEILRSYAIKAEVNIWAGIEKAQAMPKQGVVAMFNYGVGYGKYLAALAAFGISFVEIRPTEWKKEFGLIKADKERSIVVAKQLFPQVSHLLLRKKNHGRAEALLIAEYNRRVLAR